MYSRISRAHRTLPVILALLTLIGTAVLCLHDLNPHLFSTKTHSLLECVTLVLIAVAYLVYQSAHRPPWKEWVKAGMLVIAFLLWAGSQIAPVKQALIMNDVSIVLFVLDIFLVIVGWPKTSPDESFAESVGQD